MISLNLAQAQSENSATATTGLSSHPVFQSLERHNENIATEDHVSFHFPLKNQFLTTHMSNSIAEEWDVRFGRSPALEVNVIENYGDGMIINGFMVTGTWGPVSWDGFQSTELISEPLVGKINEVVIFDENIYIAGDFLFQEGSIADIAFWDGTQWRDLPFSASGITQINKIIVTEEGIFAGGLFTNADNNQEADYIAFWDGNMWNNLGSGLNDQVHTMNLIDGILYVGGEFTNAGGIENADHIAIWNGAEWGSIGDGLDGDVYVSLYRDDLLYVGGDFENAGGNEDADHIAMWNGLEWSNLGNSIDQEVYSMIFLENTLYIGGDFFNPENRDINTPAGGIAFWDGNAWKNVGGGLTGVADVLHEFNGELFAGGRILGTEGGINGGTAGITKWNGTEWLPLTSGVPSEVFATTMVDQNLYIGGAFPNPEGNQFSVPIQGMIARWGGQHWRNVGNGLNNEVHALIEYNGELIVGGSFTNAGGLSNADGVVNWDDTEWHNLGVGLSPTCDRGIQALLELRGSLYAGGCFSNPGDNAAIQNIARWDGSQWNALSDGLNGEVHAFATDGTNLFVGGQFTDAGGVASADRLAIWNGAEWGALGESFNDRVYTLSFENGVLYAGGEFTNAGTPDADYIAKWDGTTWSSIGENFDWDVHTILPVDGDLFVGGKFSKIGDNNVAALARWNGNNWSDVGQGLYSRENDPGLVYSLFEHDNQLFVGGDFNFAGDGVQSVNFGIYTYEPSQSTAIELPANINKNWVEVSSYPNPFTQEVIFTMSPEQPEWVSFHVYDVLGRKVETLIEDFSVSSQISLRWETSQLPAGMYFYKIVSENNSSSGRSLKLSN